MKYIIIICSLTLMSSFSSCYQSSSVKNQFNGDKLWWTKNLDYLQVGPDTLSFGLCFGLHEYEYPYNKVNDTIILNAHDLFCDSYSPCELKFTIKALNKHTIEIVTFEENSENYFNNITSNDFFSENSFVVEQNWDSLYFNRFIETVDSTVKVEEIKLYPNGEVFLNTMLIDSLKGDQYFSTIPKAMWVYINKDVSAFTKIISIYLMEELQMPY